MFSPRSLAATACAGLAAACSLTASATDAPGTARVARWKDDKQAAFQLMFDDSIPSHLKTVIPELRRRGMIGTFYINPGKGEWKASEAQWKEIFAKGDMVPADHTMTHRGVADAANAEEEIGGCADIVAALLPPGKPGPRLISFGQPGVAKGKWNLSKEDFAALLAKHHLIDRPPFSGRGSMVAFHNAADMVGFVDKAIAKGASECIVFHGVGAEYITTPVPEFMGLLDGLDTRRDKVWLTDPVSAHKYATERDSAEVRTLENSASAIRLSLTDKADPQLYDAPLTLVVGVPAGWSQCQVTQGTARSVVPVKDGAAHFDALPGNVPVLLQSVVR